MMPMNSAYGWLAEPRLGGAGQQFHLGSLDASPAVILAFLMGTVVLGALALRLESRPELQQPEPDDSRAVSRDPSGPGTGGT